MKIVLFGATGMVGQGVLRECLLDPDVETVLSVGRNPTGRQHPQLREIVCRDLFDLSAVEPDLSGFDACFFCLGVSSVRMTEADYRRVTYDLTMSVAHCLVRLNPRMTLIYVSGMGTDSSEHGRTMWARVKGETENALLRLPFKGAYMFRPGLIVPLDGVRSKTRLYRFCYALLGPVLPWLYAAFPKYVTTTAQVGRAMLSLAKRGAGRSILENADINQVGRGSGRMIVLLAGLPGTGKSTLARALAARRRAAVLDKDLIRAALFEPAHVEYSAAQDDFCQELMLQTAEYLITREPDLLVLLDGRTFSRNYQRQCVLNCAARLRVPWAILECVCAGQTAAERLARDAATGRHPAANRNLEFYQTVRLAFEPILDPKLVVNTDRPLEVSVDQALTYLQQWPAAASP